jgi:phosphatidylglycerophosphate synthase
MGTDVTVGDIKDSFPEDKSDALWTRFVLRPLSFPFAWIFIKLGLSANHVTYLSIVAVLAGSGLFLLESYSLAIGAAILFNVFALLDCVDGNIARTTSGGNPYGEWVDALGGYMSYTFLFVSAGVYVGATYGGLLGSWGVNYLLAGTVAAMTNLLMRVQHQKFDNLRDTSNGESGGRPNSIQKEISRNVGITGFLMPIVLGGTIFSVLNWVLIFYLAFYAAAWVFVTLNKIRQIERA